MLDDNSLHMWTLRAHKGVSELLEIGRFTLTGPPGYDVVHHNLSDC